MRPDYRLKLIGIGPELQKIKSLVTQCGIKNRVSFLGVLSKDKIHKILFQSRALILPSLYESSPLVILEALNATTPVVASRVGGIPEMIKHTKEGILINNPKSSYQLFQAMETMIKSESKYALMSKNAFIKCFSYSLDKIIQEYIDLYNAI